jgi:hypothetical protein
MRLTPPNPSPFRSDTVKAPLAGSFAAMPFLPHTPEKKSQTAAEQAFTSIRKWFGEASQQLLHAFKPVLPSESGQPTLFEKFSQMSDSNKLAELASKYAESPTEQALFTTDSAKLTLAWKQALSSQSPLEQDAALTLFKQLLAFYNPDISDPLSPHTQLKMLNFANHLNQGMAARAELYMALLDLPPAHMLDLSDIFKHDFAAFSSLTQLMVLKRFSEKIKEFSRKDSRYAEEGKVYSELFKGLFVEFFTDDKEDLTTLFESNETFHTVYRKMQPIEAAYQKSSEKLEREYRQRLRKLKKIRGQKAEEIDQERYARIELIFDEVKQAFTDTLSDLNPAELAAPPATKDLSTPPFKTSIGLI